MQRLGTFVLALCLAFSANAEAAIKAIKFGKLWDGHTSITNAVVIVDNDKIQSVAANGAIPAGVGTIDLTRYTGIPGLIDSHTHITFYWDPASGTNPLRQPPRHVAVRVFLAQANAKKTIEAGVTTVRDLTGFDGADLALRDLIAMGAVNGPRMFVSGPGIREAAYRRPGVTDPVAEAVKLTKSIIDSGADWVKIYGSTGGADDVTGTQTVSYNEMKAIIDTAHAAGRKVAVHSYGPDGARDYIARNFVTAQKAYRAGARMLIGSDAVYTAFGLNMYELNWFVKLGMSNEQALQSATILPAEMLGMQASLGAVAPGHIADIVAVDGDPLADIGVVLNKVRWVMKSGTVVVDKTRNP